LPTVLICDASDRFLKTRGGRDRAETTTIIDEDRYASWYCRAADAGDESVLVSSCRADADLARIALFPQVADVDIVAACNDWLLCHNASLLCDQAYYGCGRLRAWSEKAADDRPRLRG
jgi:hypothetical protein